MIRVHDRGLQEKNHVDGATRALVQVSGAMGTLPTDPKQLETMFIFCTNNWRTYSGEKPTGEKLARINAIHRQATWGDHDTAETETYDEVLAAPFQKMVFNIWRSYKSTPKLTAKRRFIALLCDVDIRLLQIKAYQSKPWGFPTTPKGHQICPYSNSKKGCPRPLLDKYGHNLEHELDQNESLSDYVKLKKWLDEVAPQQRCSLGLHTSISTRMGSQFATFFARPECGGFQPYMPTSLHNMVKKVLMKQLQALVEMQNDPIKFSKIAQVQQRDRVLGLKLYYTSITGIELTNEISCSSDSHHCNTRRLAEGGNHTHPAVIRMPPTDLSLYDVIIQVRRECARLGVLPRTGPVHSIDQRCRLLQLKVVDFHRKKMLVYESQRRQQWRANIVPHDAARLKYFSQRHFSECIRNALVAKSRDRVCLLVEAGADSTSELRSGVFPLMTAVLSRSVASIRALLAAGADVDRSNSRGMTALMWAIKRDDYAMVDVLLEEGADIGVEGCTGWTAMSIAARHGRLRIAELLVDRLRQDKLAGEMNSDRALNHRSTVNGGLTPVAIAAIHRNEAMARCLMRLGARPGVKCCKGYTAGDHATRSGWKVFGLWLQETQAFGANGVYTFTDMQAENILRVATARMLRAIAVGTMADNGTADNGGDHDQQQQQQIILRRASMLSVVAGGLKLQHTALSNVSNITTVQLGHLRCNHVLTVNVLREGYAAPDTESDAGHTALISAAYRGLTSSVLLLIEEGADPNYRNRNDRTALMAASAQGHLKVILALLTVGADATVIDIDGKSAGAYAFEKGFVEVVELLAIAASSGRDAALDWERDRPRREHEESERKKTEEILRNAGGGEPDAPEADDMHDWVFRVTRPREAVRLAELRQTAREREIENQPWSAREENIRRPLTIPMTKQQHQGVRCPKCTLLVPCLHFASIKSLISAFPDGVPEWKWNSRNVNSRGKPRRKVAQQQNIGDDPKVLGEDFRSISWWQSLQQAYRHRNSQQLSSGFA